MNFILCGLPSCGKTTLAKNLAIKTSYKFIDTDALIEEMYLKQTNKKKACNYVFSLHGESFFRELEKTVITSLTNCKDSIIALGGGSLSSPQICEFIKNLGTVMYLKADPKVILKRLLKRSKIPGYLNPKDPKGSFALLVEKRITSFQTLADIEIDTSNKTILEAENLLIEKIRGFYGQ